MKCKVCKQEAAVSLRSHNAAFCEDCFRQFFHRQIQRGIESLNLFSRDERILVALSGGKDSLALALVLSSLGYDITGLYIDLAIPDSSEHARAAVEKFCAAHKIPLRIVDLAEQGLAIPLVKEAVRRPICSICGKIKRHFFNKAALEGNFDALATGHNLDDEASRLMSNTLRWDNAYLAAQGPRMDARPGFCRKVKPLWRLSEFETANYAFLEGIPHHMGACPYSAGASFSALKGWLNALERQMPGRKLDFYGGFLEHGRKSFAGGETESLAPCPACGSPTSSGDLCGVCRIRNLVQQRRTADSC